MNSRKRSSVLLAVALAVTALPAVASAEDAVTGELQEVAFGTVTPNLTGIRMYYYIPDGTKAQKPITAPMPIVVGLHSCQADQGQPLGWLQQYADAYGFLLVLPFANRVDANAAGKTGCWDVGSADALAPPPNNQSDPAAIVALVHHVAGLQCGGHACGDLGKVFATGQSSGAMMTNVLLGLYPDLFKAGASFMGVPFGCWAAGVGGARPKNPGTATTLGDAAGWSGQCAGGSVKHDAAGWVALLPSYSGPWPRMQIFHGEKDTLIDYTQNFNGEVEQWTGIHGLAATAPVATDHPNAPSGHTFTRMRFGDPGPQATVESVSIAGTDHFTSMPELAAPQIVRFFGLGDSTAPAAPSALASSAVTSSGATLTWTAPADTDVNNYVVLQVSGSTSTPVAWPAGSSATYAVTGLSAATSYTYAVAAVDKAGNVSTPSASVAVKTADAASTPSSTGGGGGGGCGQGAPSGAALILAAVAMLLVRRRAVRA